MGTRHPQASIPLTLFGRLAVSCLCLAATGCGPSAFPPVSVQPSERPEADAVVYLIGDAGAAVIESPVLTQLKRDVLDHSRSADVVVAFLGDNIYENGLHPPSDPRYEEDVRHLEAQIEVLRGTTATGVFVPGNHDWGHSGARGLETIRRQGAYLAAVAQDGVDVTFLPADGCPGPELMAVGESVLLVFLDTEWWLRYREDAESDECANGSPSAVVSSLRSSLRDNAAGSNRRLVVLAHHPLETYGSHGGYFGVKDQFFPGTNLWKPLYVPLPFLYPIVRNSGISNQDLSGPRNERMREELASVFSEFPDHPLVFAAGHEHGLQVFDGHEHGVGYVLVSGAGSRLKNIGEWGALFAVGHQQRELGYMRLEFLNDGRVLLVVITDGTRSCANPKSMDCRGVPTVRYWRWLTAERS